MEATILAWYIPTVIFIFGAIIGSFLNVVIYRMHTGKSINGSSHCLSCGTGLRWYDLFPVVSYLTLRGRCRYCASYVPLRYAVVELLTAISFLWLFFFAQTLIWWVLFALLASLLIVTLVYDLYHMIIPNELPALLTLLAVTMLVYRQYPDFSWWTAGESLLAGVIAAGFFASLWLLSRGRWLGLGDAKLAFPLGLLVGLSGVFSLIVWSFWIGAVVSLLYMALLYVYRCCSKTAVAGGGKYLTMKSEIPFAPFLIASFVVTFFTQWYVLTFVTSSLSFFIGY